MSKSGERTIEVISHGPSCLDGVMAAAAGATDEPVAVFLRVRAQLLALYNENEKSVAGFVNVARHDPDLALAGGDDAGAVRADEARLAAGERAGAAGQFATGILDAGAELPRLCGDRQALA